MSPLRIAIVDDSPFACRLLASFLEQEEGLVYVGSAHTPEAALKLIAATKPNLMTLGVEMPGGGGLTLLDEVMRTNPLPVILVTGASRRAAETTHAAIRRGAIDFVLKYAPNGNVDPDDFQRELIDKVRGAGSRVVPPLRRREEQPAVEITSDCRAAFTSFVSRTALLPSAERRDYGSALRPLPQSGRSRIDSPMDLGATTATERPATRLVVIGSSTGGPLALQQLLGELPADFPAAILIAQHMPAGFTKSLAVQLARHCPLDVREAVEGDVLSAGTALVVPGDFHARITPSGQVRLDQGIKVAGHRPSIDVSMLSAVASFGNRTCAVLLTGMGSDGVEGLAAVRAASGRTFAQEGTSCVVNGMPQRAIDRGVVDQVATPAEIAHRVIEWATANKRHSPILLEACSTRGF